MRPQHVEIDRVNMLHTNGLWPKIELAAALPGIRGGRLALWTSRGQLRIQEQNRVGMSCRSLSDGSTLPTADTPPFVC